MKYSIKNILPCKFTIISVLFFSLVGNIAHGANTTMSKLQALGKKANYADATDTSLISIIGDTVGIFLGVLGIIFTILLLMAGFNYMIAQGDESKVKNSIASIRHAIIGLIITISSFAIYSFVWSKLTS